MPPISHLTGQGTVLTETKLTSDNYCHILEWDSKFFGSRIARARPGIPPDAIPELLRECLEKGVGCLYFLVSIDNVDIVASLEKYGFGLKDVRVTLRHPNPSSTRFGNHVVRPAEPADLDILRGIARSSHRNSRFYFDPRFPRDRCDELFDVWISKSCSAGYADRVFVSEFHGEAAGYVTCSMVSPRSGQIGLLAVAPEARGAGAGRSLTHAALAWLAQQGAEDVVTVTQARNVGAMRCYERCGFVTDKTQIWYHRWF